MDKQYKEEIVIGTMKTGLFSKTYLEREPFTTDAECLYDCQKIANYFDRTVKLMPSFLKTLDPALLANTKIISKGKYVKPSYNYSLTLLEGKALDNAINAALGREQ